MKDHSLKTPLTMGEKKVVSLTLQTLTAGAAIDAAADAERVQFTPSGEPVVVASPVLAAAERVRRQVRKLICEDGTTMDGPMNLGDLRKLSEDDYLALIDAVEALDVAYLEREEGTQGRDDATDAGNDSDGGGA